MEEISESTKKETQKSSLPLLLIISVISLALSVVGAFCYYHSIGINTLIDTLSFLCFAGLWISLIVLVVSVFSFFNFLFRLKWRKILLFLLIGFISLFSIGIVMPTMGRIPPKYFKEECTENLQKIYGVFQQYKEQNNGFLPAEDWCDMLITKKYGLDPRYLSCRGLKGGFIEGESSYAFNKNTIGRRAGEISSEAVLLFETDYCGDNPDKKVDAFFRMTGRSFDKQKPVREGAWNQVRDIEILTCSHHAGLGCNVLFADGHVEFVKKKDLPNLRWKP